LAEKAGITHPVSPTALRDAHAAALLASGSSISIIQRRLGFSCRKDAVRYVEGLG
jgi:site-specific recombinase XerD